MHILIIPSEHYVPKESPLSGIFQYHQAHALINAGYNVGVISPQPRSLKMIKNRVFGWKRGLEVENDRGIPVYRYHGWNWFPRMDRFCSRFWTKIGMKLFERYIKDHGVPDIVHAHNAVYAGILANQIKDRFGIPYIITEHSSYFARALVSGFLILEATEVYKNADVLAVVSPNLGKFLELRFGDAVQSWEWIPNILDARFEEDAFTSERKKNGRFYFLNIANMDRNKGQQDLIEAFAEKFRGREDVRLRIGGDGPLRRKLKNLAGDLGIGAQLDFLGYLDRKQILDEMRACDAFVLSSHYETFGAVLIEALACGKPVISTACGGPECIVDKNNGMLVPVKDIASMGDAMAMMKQGSEYFDKNSIRARCIANFGEEAFIRRISKMYERICG